MKITSRVVGLYTAFLLSVSVMGVAPAAVAAPDVASRGEVAVVENAGAQEVDTIIDLKKMRGASGTVATKGHVNTDDGAGMEFSIEAKQPEGVLGNIAVPLADGKWAVPNDLPTGPNKPVDNAAVDDAIARAKTFVAAGDDLRWDAHGLTPIHTSGIVHEKFDKPYPIYCSSFIGMVLKGWDYEHTTYVSDTNTSVGASVDLGEEANITDVEDDMWQSNKLARWFYTHGDLWLNDGKQNYERGDLLFIADQKPEGSDANTGAYFGNIYHVAMYIGDNKVIHSYSPNSDGGVVEQEIDDFLRNGTAFIARPNWEKAGNAGNDKPANSTENNSPSDNSATVNTGKCSAEGDDTTNSPVDDPDCSNQNTDDSAQTPVEPGHQGQLSH